MASWAKRNQRHTPLFYNRSRSTWRPLPKQKSCFLLCLLPTKKYVFFNDFFYSMDNCTRFPLPTQTSGLLWLIYSMGRSTWCLLPTQKSYFLWFIFLWTGVHGVRCQQQNLVFYDWFILWTRVHVVCCHHKNLVFYDLFIL